MTENPVTVLIADDHPITRSGMKFALQSQAQFEIVAVASDGVEALELITSHRPDVVILDLMLPKMSGLMVLEAIAKRGLDTRVLLVTGQGTAVHYQHALHAGARGVASKEDSPEEIIEAIDTILAGQIFRSQSVARLLGQDQSDLQGENHALTQREQEVIALVAQGASNKIISRDLGIAHNTVRKHRENIRRKTGLSNSVELTRLAAQLGLAKLL